jgi:lipoprotein NlpD
MKPTPRLALLTLSLGILSACSTETRQAPVIDRPAPTAIQLPSASTTGPGAGRGGHEARRARHYTVRRGDTLLRIALDHGQNYRDLVTWNNLSDPDDIKVGQVLKVAPSERNGAAVVTTPITMPGAEKAPAVPKKTDAARRQEAVQRRRTWLRRKDDPPADPKAAERPGRRGRRAAPSPPTTTRKLSWMWPSDGKIVATFDEGKNKGIDIAGKMGQQVMAAGSGKGDVRRQRHPRIW